MDQGSSSTATAVKDKRNEDILSVLEYWKKFDLEERKILLDVKVVETPRVSQLLAANI